MGLQTIMTFVGKYGGSFCGAAGTLESCRRLGKGRRRSALLVSHSALHCALLRFHVQTLATRLKKQKMRVYCLVCVQTGSRGLHLPARCCNAAQDMTRRLITELAAQECCSSRSSSSPWLLVCLSLRLASLVIKASRVFFQCKKQCGKRHSAKGGGEQQR